MATAFTATITPSLLTTDRRPPARRPPAFVSVRAAAPSSSKASVASGNRPLRGIMRPQPVSPAMQAIVGVPEIPRTKALKILWTYIKENNLQDPENKRVIVCDEKLKSLFGGRERVGFLEVAKLLNPHFAQ